MPLQAKNLAEVFKIENKASKHPWSKKAHQDSVQQNYPSLFLTSQGKMVGFIVFNFLADECHLLNIAIDPELQGNGHGQQLIKAMIDEAELAQMKMVILEVRKSNLSALNLYRKLNFEQIGLRKNYYRSSSEQDSTREDAIVMQKAL